jgi:UDP-2,3-diacylglucosamine pyrophosphatase LpxH
MGDFINSEIKPDMILWSGDITAHDIWKYSLEEVKKYTHTFADFLKDKFLGQSLYPVEGNHDFEIMNS